VAATASGAVVEDLTGERLVQDRERAVIWQMDIDNAHRRALLVGGKARAFTAALDKARATMGAQLTMETTARLAWQWIQRVEQQEGGDEKDDEEDEQAVEEQQKGPQEEGGGGAAAAMAAAAAAAAAGGNAKWRRRH
jgi:hypothetical protein